MSVASLNSNNQQKKKKKREYHRITKENALLIAKTYLETGNATEALRRTFKIDSPYLRNYATRSVRNSPYVQEYLEKLQSDAWRFFDNIAEIANLPLENPEKHPAIAKIKLDANKDMLDRLGYSAIKKSVVVKTSPKEIKNLAEVQKRIEELEALLAEKERDKVDYTENKPKQRIEKQNTDESQQREEKAKQE